MKGHFLGFPKNLWIQWTLKISEFWIQLVNTVRIHSFGRIFRSCSESHCHFFCTPITYSWQIDIRYAAKIRQERPLAPEGLGCQARAARRGGRAGGAAAAVKQRILQMHFHPRQDTERKPTGFRNKAPFKNKTFAILKFMSRIKISVKNCQNSLLFG